MAASASPPPAAQAPAQAQPQAAPAERLYQKPKEPVRAPYGAWDSPLSAAVVSGAGMKLGGIGVGPGDRLVWAEGRPSEGGRTVVMMEGGGGPSPPGSPVEVTPPGMGAKSKVHEYGGGAFAVAGDSLVFCNHKDQRVYLQDLGGAQPGPPIPLTPEYPEGSAVVRYADFCIDLRRGLVYCVREDHRTTPPASTSTSAAAPGTEHEPSNDLVAFRLHPGESLEDPTVVARGADFYAFPRLSPDGCQLAWVQWSHPNMPWDRTQLWTATLDGQGALTSSSCVAGHEEGTIEAPTEPMWSPQGQLYFVSDRNNGFWNIHRATAEGVESVLPMEGEFSRPFWVFGNRSFVFIPGREHHILCFFQRGGSSHLAVLDTQARALTEIPMPLTDCFYLESGAQRMFVAGGSPTIPYSVQEVVLSPDILSCSLSPLWLSSSPSDPSFLSAPSWVSFPSPLSPGELSHAVFYPPHNPDYLPPEGANERPPLLVRSHGGPTGSTDTMLRLPIQFWTTRGWAVADVNYSGSTGYGRPYRERLYGQWGVADVADAQACVQHLVAQGRVDPGRVVTDGSSAGGFTCLAALTFTDTFRAGCSLYGICDLAALSAIMHKFEKFYNDKLVGPLPEADALYRARSPIFHVDRLSCPVILFQGLEDKVVPPSQARVMFEAVRAKGLPVALVEYEGEDHGFRKAENIQQTLEQEILFFSRVLLGIHTLPGIDRDLHIDNMSS